MGRLIFLFYLFQGLPSEINYGSLQDDLAEKILLTDGIPNSAKGPAGVTDFGVTRDVMRTAIEQNIQQTRICGPPPNPQGCMTQEEKDQKLAVLRGDNTPGTLRERYNKFTGKDQLKNMNTDQLRKEFLASRKQYESSHNIQSDASFEGKARQKLASARIETYE